MRASPRSASVAALVALLVVGAPALAAATTSDGAAATQVDSCTTIDEPGTYVLTTDIENGGETPISRPCITITADGVTFDGQGHTLDGRGESQTKGVAVSNASNVTVRNVAVADWHYGVLVENGAVNVTEVHTYSNAYGVRLENASGSNVTNNTVEDNLVGVYGAPGDGLTFSGNALSENEIDEKFVEPDEAESDGETAGARAPAVSP